jgi:acyl carrier protein
VDQRLKNKKGEGKKMSFSNISQIIARHIGVEAGEIKPTSRFKEDLQIDSLDIFEIVMDLEEQYDLEIPTEDLEDLRTVGDLVKYIDSVKD